MSVQFTWNGVQYTIPSPGERGWGAAVTTFLQAVGGNALTTALTLAAEMDLGATYGVRAKWFRSQSSNPAGTGVGRFANTDKLSFRNAANGADLPFGVDSSDNLEFNAVDVATVSATQTLTNKTLTAPVLANVKDTTRAYARYTRATSLTLVDGAQTIIDFATSVLDSRTAVTTGAAWKFTVPTGHAGLYRVSVAAAVAAGTTSILALDLFKGGVWHTRLAWAPTTAGDIALTGEALISLADGNYVDVRGYSSAGSRALSADAKYNHINIIRELADI